MRAWLKIAASGLFLAFTFIVGCAPSAPNHTGEVLRRGLGGEPATLDPAQSSDNFSNQVIMDLYEGLTRESPSGETVPAAAESWQVSADGKTYTFKLRPHLTWSNGESLSARDFVRSWRRVVDPKSGSPQAEILKVVDGAGEIIAGHALPETLNAQAPTDDMVVVHLTRPAAYFPALMSHPAAFPVYSESAAKAHVAKDAISNGAYTLSEWRPGSMLALTKSSSYWDADRVKILIVDYRIATDENAQYAQFRAGELDLTDTAPANALGELKAQSPSPLIVTPYLATANYLLNMDSAVFAHNVNLRRALSLAIDRARVVQALGAGQQPAKSFLPPDVWNYQSPASSLGALDDESRVQEAKRLFREAGYSQTQPLKLRVLINSNTGIKRTAVLIAAMWKETLGIDTEILEEEFRVFLESRQDPTRFEVVRLGWVADYNDASTFLETFRSGAVNNNAHYSNPKFDQVLDEAEATVDPNKRAQVLEASERVLLEDCPVIPLYDLVSKRLAQPYVSGVTPSPLNRLLSKDLKMAAH